jgi:hypothetical protein
MADRNGHGEVRPHADKCASSRDIRQIESRGLRDWKISRLRADAKGVGPLGIYVRIRSDNRFDLGQRIFRRG